MSGYPLVLLLASLPALGNFAGALLAEVFDVSERAWSCTSPPGSSWE